MNTETVKTFANNDKILVNGKRSIVGTVAGYFAECGREVPANMPDGDRFWINLEGVVLSGDGTRESRKAAYDADMAARVSVSIGEEIEIEGRRFIVSGGGHATNGQAILVPVCR